MKTKRTVTKLLSLSFCLYFVHFIFAHQLPEDLIIDDNSSYISVVVLEFSLDELLSITDDQNNSYIELLEAKSTGVLMEPCSSDADVEPEKGSDDTGSLNKTCGQLDHISGSFFKSVGHLVDACNNYANENKITQSLFPKIISPQILLDSNHHDFGTKNSYGSKSITFECVYPIKPRKTL